MTHPTRRTLLRFGVLGAAALNLLYPNITRVLGLDDTGTLAATNSPAKLITGNSLPGSVVAADPTKPDLTYAGGRVVSKTESGVVLDADGQQRAVRIGATGVNIWKESDGQQLSAIQVGDTLDVKGDPLPDGSLQAKEVYVNIGRFEGKVEQVSGNTVTAVSPRGARKTLELATKVEIVQAQKDFPAAAGGVAALKPGTEFGAVGVRLPNGGFRATRIWIYPPRTGGQ